jgi:hypothetical protein
MKVFEMQLTKGDVLESGTYRPSLHRAVLDYSKFQQVVEFYDANQTPKILRKNNPEICEKWLKYYYDENNLGDDDKMNEIYLQWLFRHCFQDGLK